MFVQIRCSNPGHTGRVRAGRSFSNGTTYRMEVLERPLADNEKDKHGNGPVLPDGSLDMERIDRAGYLRVKADPVMSTIEGGAIDAQLSREAFEELRSQLKFANESFGDAKIRIADLEGQIAALTASTEKTGDEKTAKSKK